MQEDLGTLCYIIYKEGFTMKVNPRTIKLILDFVAAIALAASGVIAKEILMDSLLVLPRE